jgi:MFS family permease
VTPGDTIGRAEQQIDARHRNLVLAIACAVALMTVLDVSVVTVALPAVRDDLGLSATGLQWVVNAYSLTFAGFLLLGGRAADLLGRKRVFLFGLVVFTAASLAGGLAQAGWQLVAARAVQGIGGAVLAPVTLSLLTTTFTEPAEKARALGTWSAVAGLGGALGGVVGGVLTGLLDWRWVLIVNVPVGALLVTASVWALTPAPACRSAAGSTCRDLPRSRWAPVAWSPGSSPGRNTAGARRGRWPCSPQRSSPSSSSCSSSGAPQCRWCRCRCSGSGRSCWRTPSRC